MGETNWREKAGEGKRRDTLGILLLIYCYSWQDCTSAYPRHDE